MRVMIINGPNLNLLGQREPDIYGSESFDKIMEALQGHFATITIDFFQSNIEGELIDRLQEADGKYDGIILNAGAYTHTSVALGDTIRAINTAVIEVHLSNVFAREEFRHNSFIAPYCIGSISGFGPEGYRLALEALKNKSENRFFPRI